MWPFVIDPSLDRELAKDTEMQKKCVMVQVIHRASDGPEGDDRGVHLYRQCWSLQRPADTMQDFSRALFGLKKDSVQEALHRLLSPSCEVQENYDTINSKLYGCENECYYYHFDPSYSGQHQWIFDLEQDKLFFKPRSDREWREMPISDLREFPLQEFPFPRAFYPDAVPTPKNSIQVSDSPFKYIPEDFKGMVAKWKPEIQEDAQLTDFVTFDLLSPFGKAWNHVLDYKFNFVTLQKLAKAIVDLATLNFSARTLIESDQVRRGGLPQWESYEKNIVKVGRTWLIICRSIKEGISVAEEHLSSPEMVQTLSSREDCAPVTNPDYPIYTILSVRHIVLCNVVGTNKLVHTSPESLFVTDIKGWLQGGPLFTPGLAVKYLLWATSGARVPISTTLLSLPMEIQDMVLDYICDGVVPTKQFYFLLRLGTSFKRKAILESVEKTEWPPDFCYEIYFGECGSKVELLYGGSYR